MTSANRPLRIASRDGVRAADAAAPPRNAAEGVALLRAGGLVALRNALAVRERDDDGWWHFWRGWSAQFDDLALARRHWLQAERCFERDGDPEGVVIAACGLTQATSLDRHDYADFDRRVALLLERPPCAAVGDELDLLRVGARLTAAAEQWNVDEAAAPQVALVFRALGSDLETEARLRAVICALPLLGLALDRAQTEDFLHAGAQLAQSPRVGDYGRALWHLHIVNALYYDAGRAAQLEGELDRLDRLAGEGEAMRRLRGRALAMRAAVVLGVGDVAAAQRHLDAAEPLIDPALPMDGLLLHFYRSRQALQAGRAEEAWTHLHLCGTYQARAQLQPARATVTVMQEGHVLCALHRFDEAAQRYQRAADLSRGAQATPCQCHVHLARALQRLDEGAHAEAAAELRAGFALARTIGLTHFLRALPDVAARLCAAALELDADASFALAVIAARRLPCPDHGTAAWPWPLKLRTLGGLTLERDGRLLKAQAKGSQRLVDLLRLLVALGGRCIDAERVVAIHWADADGQDAGIAALKATVHRARALLGADAVALRGGQIGFDDRGVWIDTWAFEEVGARIESLLAAGPGERVDDGALARARLQLLALYRGHLFGDGDVPWWAAAMRDRLRTRFVRCIELLGQRLQTCGRLNEAVDLYHSALERDALAEELHRRLIECHLARGEPAQAMGAYRRCRELLWSALGLRPSARTQALVARWTNG